MSLPPAPAPAPPLALPCLPAQMSNPAMDTDDGTDGTDPDADAASGSMMVTGAGEVVVTRKPRKPVVYALDKTMVGFKELRQFFKGTVFFRKLKQFKANVKCVILIQGVQSKNGIAKMCKLSIGNTPYAQGKADEYMSNFGIAEVRDDSDARIVKSMLPEMPQMYASEPYNVGGASAVNITKVLWHKAFDDVKTVDGKFGRDCKQIWNIARDNPHMMPAWWNEIMPHRDVAFTTRNAMLNQGVIIKEKGNDAYNIKMQQYHDAMGGVEEAEKVRHICVIQDAVDAIEEIEEPWVEGLVASMKSIVLVKKATPGEALAKALAAAGFEVRAFSESLHKMSNAEYAKMMELNHQYLAQNATEYAQLDVNAVRSKAIEAGQSVARAELNAAKANADLEAAQAAQADAEYAASKVPTFRQCKRTVLCDKESRHNGPCCEKTVGDLLDVGTSRTPWRTYNHAPSTMLHIRELVTTGGKTMAEAFGVVNWHVAADKKMAYDDWYNAPYIVDQFGEMEVVYGDALWAEIVKRFIDEIIPPPPVAMKSKKELAKEEIAARKAAKAVEKAAMKAEAQQAKAARQEQMDVREAATAKRLKAQEEARNMFAPMLNPRQAAAAAAANERRAQLNGY